MGVSEHARLPVPALDEFPGVRALGQWPHDIFPFGPERSKGVTPEDKNPVPVNIRTRVLGTEQVEVAGRSFQAVMHEKRWEASVRDRREEQVLTVWIAEGVELPLKWTQVVDGKAVSASTLLSLAENVEVAGTAISCMVTTTTKHSADGDIVKKRWSSKAVPGFLVKMESRLETVEFSLSVQEWVTAFQATAKPHAPVEAAASGGRPALGLRPNMSDSGNGVLVDAVTPGGNADKGGILAGDRIIALDEEAVAGLESYSQALSRLRVGQDVTVKLLRDGAERTHQVRVGQRAN